jgi:hypothetical protein
MPNTLEPYIPSTEKPWNQERVQHLYQRLGFGADFSTLSNGLDVSPSELVNQLIDGVIAMPAPEQPYWANWDNDDYPNDGGELFFQVKEEFFLRWVEEMATQGLRSKLTLFWHNHFVTEEEVYYCNAYMWAYYKLLHDHALGNFKTFVEEMGINPAMLVYLNGNQNVAAQPNENYARELMELFTMGENNGYTQQDIVEVARALTGWQVNMYGCSKQVFFSPAYHDNGTKTIFGQTGNWDYLDVHNLIFSERENQVAEYICGKLYRFFVYEEEDPTIVQGLADTFKQNNWEIAPVLRQLFKSEHFFEERFINARIKSPLESLTHLLTLSGAEKDVDYSIDYISYIAYASSQMGQRVFNPVDVAGWPGYHSWMTENTLTARWSYSAAILNGFAQNDSMREKLRILAMALTSESENDPTVITEALIRHFIKRELDPPLLDAALLYFKSEVPENYFEDGSWNLYYDEVPDQVLSLLGYLTRLPEWQVC